MSNLFPFLPPPPAGRNAETEADPFASVNMLSIWRLQSIVETRATTLPTFDPTWYGATPIVLSMLEVGLANICASLPVFWPVLKKQLGPYIMVTHEVKITRESRRNSHWDADDMELRRNAAVSGESTNAVSVISDYYRSPNASEHQSKSHGDLKHSMEVGRVSSMRSTSKYDGQQQDCTIV